MRSTASNFRVGKRLTHKAIDRRSTARIIDFNALSGYVTPLLKKADLDAADVKS